MTTEWWRRNCIYVALVVVLVAMILWIRWMIVAPHWLELFR